MRRKLSRFQANTLLLCVAVIWGAAFVPQKIAAQQIPPFTFTGIRFLIGGLLLLPWVLKDWRSLAARGHLPDLRLRMWMTGMGCLLFIGVALQQVGMLHASVTHAGFITGLYVPLVPLLGWMFYGRMPNKVVWFAAAMCFTGIVLLTQTGDSTSETGLNLGDLWILATVLPFALHMLWVGSVADELGAPILLAFWQFMVCAGLSFVGAVLWETPKWSDITAVAWPLCMTSVGSVTLGFTGQVLGQRDARPAEAAIILSAEAFFAALAGALFLGERLPTMGYVGGALILVGIAWVQCLPSPLSTTAVWER